MEGLFPIIFLFIFFSVISSAMKSGKKKIEEEQRRRASQQAELEWQRKIATGEMPNYGKYYENAPDDIPQPTYIPDFEGELPGTFNASPIKTTTIEASETVHSFDSEEHPCIDHRPVTSFEGNSKATALEEALPLDERLKRYKANKARNKPLEHVTGSKTETYKTQKSLQTVSLDVSAMQYDSKTLLQGLVYSEILGKPKSLK